MKLLSKQEIALGKSKEHKLEIDQGVTLARKLEYLREANSKEEATLSKFREENLKQIKEEITSAVEERNALLKQVEDLRENKKYLRGGVHDEWDDIIKANKQLDYLQSQLDLKDAQIRDKEAQIDQNLAQIKELSLKATQKSQQLTDLVIKTDEERQNLLKYVEESKQKVSAKEAEINQKVVEINHKASDISAKERDLELQKTSLEAQMKDIINQKILLIDREQTLERELTRQRNGKQ